MCKQGRPRKLPDQVREQIKQLSLTMTPRQISEKLNISKNTVYPYTRAQKIKSVKKDVGEVLIEDTGFFCVENYFKNNMTL